MASCSAGVRSPARARAAAQARLPRRSCGHSRRSKLREAVKRSAVGSAPVTKRPLHAFIDSSVAQEAGDVLHDSLGDLRPVQAPLTRLGGKKPRRSEAYPDWIPAWDVA